MTTTTSTPLRPGRLYPVCCATDVSAEFKDHFIQLNEDYEFEVEYFFVFVDSIAATYNIADEMDENTASSPSSPFKGKTLKECAELLRQLRLETGSDINHESFVVVDERSLKDDTALIVSAEDGEEIVSVRITIEATQQQLMVYLSGKVFISEDIETARRTEDGVLRPKNGQW